MMLGSIVSALAVSGGGVCAHGAEISDVGYQRISYQGKNYDYNSRITVVMYVGIDSGGELTTYNRYSIAPRADTIDLLILDDYHKTIKFLGISRDTIATINRYAMDGTQRNSYETQIGYAFSYGDGGKASCLNLSDAVSDLLGGVPIHEYVVTNNESIVRANDFVGQVTVTVPNNDLVELFPEMTEGSTVTLDASNVDSFVRYRDISIPFTNQGRMERQEAYITEYFKKMRDMIVSDPENAWKQMESMKSDFMTSITKNQYLKLANLIAEESFTDDNYFYLAGENVQEELHDAVYLKEDELQEMILELFYLEDGVDG